MSTSWLNHLCWRRGLHGLGRHGLRLLAMGWGRRVLTWMLWNYFIVFLRVWGIRPAKVCEASKLQSLFGASRLKASKPQSCKASLAPHASKPQSSKASLAPHASKPQSCKASLAPHASKPQSLKAWTLGCFGALVLWRLAALSGFGASWRFSDASKPQSLNAWMLWRFGAWRLLHALALLDAFPTPQSLKAWALGCFGASARVLRLKASKPERLDALALWRLDALALWRLALLMLWCLLALWRFAALWRFDALALWRFGAWRSWCFGASWPFGALRLFDALALLGALRLRGSVTLWHFAALWDMPSWKKSDFVDFTFFASTDWNIGIKAVSEKKTKAQIVCIWGPALTCSQRTYDYLFSNFCGLFNDGLP